MATTSAHGGTVAVDDPTDLNRSEYLAAFKRTLKEVKDDDVPGLAAGVAFKMFLAIFPGLLAGVAIFSIVTTPAEIANLIKQANVFLPERALDLITMPLRNLAEGGGGAAGFAAIAGIAAGVFSATSAAVSMMKALSRAYDVPEDRKFVRQRLIGLALTIALVVALLGVALLLIAGPQVQDSLLGQVPPPLSWVLAGVRFLLALVVLIVLFAFVYWIGPNRERPSWLWMSPGAAFAVIGWLLVSGAFTIYVQNFGKYNETYGAIAGVALLLIWLQLSMLVILMGAEFNAEIARSRAARLRVAEGAGFAAPAPAAALAPDGMAAAAHVREAEVSANTLVVAPSTVPTHSPAGLPLPAAGAPGAQRSSVRRGGAAVAAGMAAAVFLGFARKRSRR